MLVESFTSVPIRHKIIDGILVVKPTRSDIENMAVGDFAPNVFGKFARVKEIFARGISIHNKAYVCYYVEFGDNGTISESMTEDETVCTLPLGNKYQRSENYPQI
jgi:hypothetical protein